MVERKGYQDSGGWLALCLCKKPMILKAGVLDEKEYCNIYF
jgi:hypothetical protein